MKYLVGAIIGVAVGITFWDWWDNSYPPEDPAWRNDSAHPTCEAISYGEWRRVNPFAPNRQIGGGG